MVTEDYVSFKIAKLLKEKGFNEICEMFYCKPHEGYMRNRKRNEWWNSDLREDMTCTCPTLQIVMKWLRENHNIHINIDIHWLHFAHQNGWMYTITKILENGTDYIDSKGDENDKTFYSSYEEACEAAIRYTLENLI